MKSLRKIKSIGAAVLTAAYCAYLALASPTVEAGSKITLPHTTQVSSALSPTSSSWYDGYDFASKGVVAFWPMDENANDVTGNGNNGIVNGAVLTTGRFGQAYEFDGLDDRIQVNTTLMNGFPELTMVCWIRADTFKSNEVSYFISQTGKDGDFGPADIGAYPNVARFNVSCASNDYDSIGSAEVSTLMTNIWYPIAGTYDGSIMRLYVNGEQVAEAAKSPNGNLISNNQTLFIGNDDVYNYIRGFDGTIDEAVIFDRALSDSEVLALASDTDNNGIADFWIEAGPSLPPGPDIYLNPGDSINETLDSIVASEDNQTTLHLAPGIYEEDVTMDEWENITGDERYGSIIKGSVKTTNNTSLTNLTVQNPELYDPTVCIDSNDVSPIIQYVIVDGNGNPLSLGILVAGPGSDNAEITNNEIIRHRIGVVYNNSDATLRGNTISNCEYGVWYANPVDDKGKQLRDIRTGNRFENIILHQIVDSDK